MSPVPKVMKALVVVESSNTESGRDIELQEVAVPELASGQYRVKTEAVALNPTDWKATHHPRTLNHKTGMIAGCDFAGTIIEVGPETKRFKVGDRVAGWVHGSNVMNPQWGAFAQYISGDEHAMYKLPEHVSFEEGASSGVAIATTGTALYWNEALGFPTLEELGGKKLEEDLLVYGGSTSVSQMMIQVASLMGLRVITAAGSKNHEMLKSYGADIAVDYKDPKTCIETVRNATGGKLKYAYDGISTEYSSKIVNESMGDEPGKVIQVLRIQDLPHKENIKPVWILAYFGLGRETEFSGKRYPGVPAMVETFKKTFESFEKLFAEKKLRHQSVNVLPGGLTGIRDGYELGLAGKLGPQKLVWRIADTPGL